MNLTNFLKQIDIIIAQCSKEQLDLFIHDTGRVLPEHCREEFLRRLKAAGRRAEQPTSGAGEEADFDKKYELVRNNLKMYGDEAFSLRDMVHHKLLHCNLKQVILDTAYCAYHAALSAKRPEALYGIVVNAKDNAITLIKNGRVYYRDG